MGDVWNFWLAEIEGLDARARSIEASLLSRAFYFILKNPVLWAGAEFFGSAENDDTRCLNSKSEYRNPKQIQSSNVPMTETNTQSCSLGTECRIAQFRSFDIVSNFGFRDSDLYVL